MTPMPVNVPTPALAGFVGSKCRFPLLETGDMIQIVLRVLLCLSAGCAHQGLPPTVETAAGSGRVFSDVLLDPAAAATEPGEREVFEAPRQLAGNAMPKYPPELIQAKMPPQSVVARIIVDRTGQVVRVESLPAVEGAGEADSRFLDAVRTAVMGWRFEPFQVIRWVQGPDLDGDGDSDSETVGSVESRPFRFDMRFRFEVVDGKAEVSS
jgi:hypothetical protein